MDIFVGNLPFEATDAQLAALFQPYGHVDSARIILDRETQRSRGYGFVRMGSEAEAQAAARGLDQYLWQSNGKARALNVKPADPRPQQSPRSFSRARG